MIAYIKPFLTIVLLWAIDPSLNAITVATDGSIVSDILGNIKDILSAVTTMVIFVTALIKYRKERKTK